MISEEKIKFILKKYGVDCSKQTAYGVQRYVQMLLRWNQRIALTTVTNEEEILSFHFGESIFALKAVPITHGRLADVGSGAGFPGMALALFCPQIDCVLIESNRKKTAFLNEIVRELNLKNVKVVADRMENVKSSTNFDFLCARALGNYPQFLDWSLRNIDKSGEVVLWLGISDAETIIKDDRFSWRNPIEIPDSKQRVLLVGSNKS